MNNSKTKKMNQLTEMGRIVAQGPHGQRVITTPFQPIAVNDGMHLQLNRKKAGCGSAHLSSQLQRKHEIGGLWSRSVWEISKTISPNNQSEKNWRHGSNSRVPA
jgi:hypothetical protein